MEFERLDDAHALARTPDAPEAFAVFYRRHEEAVLGYMLRHTRDGERAADLAAETFATAFAAAARFRPGPRPPVAWLFGIAHHVLSHSVRRQRVESRARRKLAMPVLELDDATVAEIERIDALAVVESALAALPPDQAEAIRARVIEDADYALLATRMRCSEQVARKRVSRGLAALRADREETG